MYQDQVTKASANNFTGYNVPFRCNLFPCFEISSFRDSRGIYSE